jgi:heme exporter protein C
MIWKFGSLLVITVMVIVSFTIPLGGLFQDAARNVMVGSTKAVPVRARVTAYTDSPAHVATATDAIGATRDIYFPSSRNISVGDDIVVDVVFTPVERRFEAQRVVSVNPLFAYPYIPGLEERARIMFYHVPMSWVATVAFFVSMTFGIMHLRSKRMEDDTKSAAAAGLGFLFALLATVTGSIWAKFNWGSYWNWDPRETSIFLLLLVYGAYFALRMAVEDQRKRAALSAVYAILAAVTVPFFIFIMPRILPGLHPGSQGDVNSGPVVSGQINSSMRVVYISSFVGFIGIFTWLMQLRVRIARLAAPPQE